MTILNSCVKLPEGNSWGGYQYFNRGRQTVSEANLWWEQGFFASCQHNPELLMNQPLWVWNCSSTNWYHHIKPSGVSYYLVIWNFNLADANDLSSLLKQGFGLDCRRWGFPIVIGPQFSSMMGLSMDGIRPRPRMVSPIKMPVSPPIRAKLPMNDVGSHSWIPISSRLYHWT